MQPDNTIGTAGRASAGGTKSVFFDSSVNAQIDFAIDLVRVSRLALRASNDCASEDAYMIGEVLAFVGDLLCDCNAEVSQMEGRQ